MNFIPTNRSTPLGTIVSHFFMECKYLSKVFSRQMYINFTNKKLSNKKYQKIKRNRYDGIPLIIQEHRRTGTYVKQ